MLNLKLPADLAGLLDVPLSELNDVARNMRRHVRRECRKTRPGKVREIRDPNPRLRAIEDRIKERILDRIPLPDCAHAYRKGRSPETAAMPHIGARWLLSLDVKSFFPNVHYRRVYCLWLGLGCGADVARLLARLTTFDYHLAQGLKTSNGISNLLFLGVDANIERLCRKYGLTYTRYSDNLYVSGPHMPICVPRLCVKFLRQVGMNLPANRVVLRGPGERKSVTGLTVNQKINVTRSACDRVRAAVHQLVLRQTCFDR
jgi:hypothetical protein